LLEGFGVCFSGRHWMLAKTVSTTNQLDKENV